MFCVFEHAKKFLKVTKGNIRDRQLSDYLTIYNKSKT
jgi:hypothetical protein